MAASILAPFKPTNQPYKEGPRGLFTLSWAQQPMWGGAVRDVGSQGKLESNHVLVCVVHCQFKAFEETFHSRRSRFEGHWVGAVKGWVFPANHSQKVANLVDQVSGYLGSKGVTLAPKAPPPKAQNPNSPEAAAAAAKFAQNVMLNEIVLARSLKNPWTFKKAGIEATFLPHHIFFGGPAVQFRFDYDPSMIAVVRKIPGAAWDASAKVWLTPGRSIRVARKLLAAIVRSPRWFREEGKRQRAARPELAVSMPEVFAQEGGEFLLDDPERGVTWAGNLKHRHSGLQSLATHFISLGNSLAGFHSDEGAVGDAGDNMPKYWLDSHEIPPAPKAPPEATALRAATANKVLSVPNATPGALSLYPHRDWQREGLAAGLRLLSVIAPHIEFGAEGIRVRANQKKATPDGIPALRGPAPNPGEVFLSQGRFWMVGTAADVKVKTQRCWAVSEAFARQWLYPEPSKSISNFTDLGKLSDAEVFLWLVDSIRADYHVGCKDIAYARHRCETLTGGPLALIMSQFERATLQKEVQAATAAMAEAPSNKGPGKKHPGQGAMAQPAKRQAKRL